MRALEFSANLALYFIYCCVPENNFAATIGTNKYITPNSIINSANISLLMPSLIHPATFCFYFSQ